MLSQQTGLVIFNWCMPSSLQIRLQRNWNTILSATNRPFFNCVKFVIFSSMFLTSKTECCKNTTLTCRKAVSMIFQSPIISIITLYPSTTERSSCWQLGRDWQSLLFSSTQNRHYHHTIHQISTDAEELYSIQYWLVKTVFPPTCSPASSKDCVRWPDMSCDPHSGQHLCVSSESAVADKWVCGDEQLME